MTFSEAGYTGLNGNAAGVRAPRVPPTTERSARVELRDVRSGKDSTLGAKSFNLDSYFLPLEPACAAIGIQRTATCASKFPSTPSAVDDVRMP